MEGELRKSQAPSAAGSRQANLSRGPAVKPGIFLLHLFAMSRFNPASAGQSLDDAIRALKGDLTAPPAASQLDSWLRLLDGEGSGAQGAMLLEMTNLKNYIRQGDLANITHSLHTLGQLTTKAAAETDVDEEISSKLRRLGEALNAASTTVAG